jgi:hypothetical protein
VSTCVVLVVASSNYCIGTYNWGVVSILMQRFSSRFRFEVHSGWLLLALLCVCAMMAHGTVEVVVQLLLKSVFIIKNAFCTM